MADKQKQATVVSDHLSAEPEFQRLLNAAKQAPQKVQSTTELPYLVGTAIGPWRLQSVLGSGGMGVVYAAQQSEPMRREVALKVIKPGMDSREVIHRFQSERQALALMDHPHIASVIDAGTTSTGLPFFVMELIRGLSITRYCDEHNLTIDERLELFQSVCLAVQHAHQKGIIHRDLKPSNILVAVHDGIPVPKVIDFGVAKAIDQQLSGETVFTRATQLVGTPMYMSPEQAELSGIDIDTRSDIYSLGVVLYELLTGNAPFSRPQLEQLSFDEIRRMIREVDPPRPSERLRSLDAETLSSVAAHRSTQPNRLTQSLRGDLDWIVMKALDKDRTRRYETAYGLDADIRRFLNNDPVEACPPSTRYRIGKFVRKNRAALLVAGLLWAFYWSELPVPAGAGSIY